MRRTVGAVIVVLGLCLAATWAQKVEKVGTGTAPSGAAATRPARAAVIETSLPTQRDLVPQLAFDGNADTYFLSARPPKADDTFTLILTRPSRLKRVEVLTGKPDGGDALEAGVLETSADGNTFVKAAAFEKGLARADLGGKEIKSIRLRPSANAAGPLAVREIKLEADPQVPTFKWPIQVVLDANEVPDMIDWCNRAKDLAEEWYPVIAETLSYEGYYPPRRIDLTFKKGSRGIAAAGGNRITCYEGWFKAHPDDYGAVFHEAVHVVQSYKKPVPGWLVEGIADYMRFFIYENPPGPRIRLDPARIKYTDSYRITGAFLNWVTQTYDKDLVPKLNKACRKGEYKPELFKEYTGKDLDALFDEFKQSLTKKPASQPKTPT
jgi:hypothetical protein